MASGGRPRVLHVVDSLRPGGLELNLETVVTRTLDRFDHHVCCVRADGPVGARLAALGVPIHNLAVRGRLPWSASWKLFDCVRRLQPDVVQANNWGAIEAIPAALWTSRAGVIFAEQGIRATPRVPRREWVCRRLAPWVDVFVAPSAAIARFLVDCVGIPAAQVEQIDNGVDTERFRPRPGPEMAARLPGGSPAQRWVVSVGRLAQVKRHEVLVDAMTILASTHPDVGAVLVGDGPERESLERHVAAKGLLSRVRFVGWQGDVEAWFAAADIVVQCSESEGACNSVLQAMASGKAIVATDITNHRDMINRDVDGCLVPVGDPAALARTLTALFDDEARRADLCRAARATAMTRWSTANTVEAYVKLYSRVAARRARPTRGQG